MKQLRNIDILLIIKAIVAVFILIATFADIYDYFTMFKHKLIKIITLLAIIIIMYNDLNLGILLMIAFLLIIIQLNSTAINELYLKKTELFEAPTTNIDCDNKNKNEINQDILDYSIDEKVKPYEVFVKMMTTEQQLESASNSAFLQ